MMLDILAWGILLALAVTVVAAIAESPFIRFMAFCFVVIGTVGWALVRVI